MGRGLGRLQREILASLEESKDTDTLMSYRGGQNGFTWTDRVTGSVLHIPRTARASGMRFILPDDVYDLAAIKRAMSFQDVDRRIGPGGVEITAAFNVSFSRAVRSLIRRGVLTLVAGPRHDETTDRLETPSPDTWRPVRMDAPAWMPRQWRFVRLNANCTDLALITNKTGDRAS